MIKFTVERIQSFRHAFAGLKDILITEHNAKVHAVFTLLALFLGWWLAIPNSSWLFVALAIVLVWMSEAFNTVLEIVIDIVSPQYSEAAKRGKNIAAAAVLFSAIAALVIGLLVFLEPLKFKLGL